VRVDRRYNELAYYAVGLCIAVFCYGIVESAVITGGTIVGLLLPFSIALVDRISEFIREHQAWALAYDDGYDDGSGGWDHEGHDDGDDSWDHEHNADDEGHHHGDHESPGYHDARWETHDYAEEGSVDGH
ncbi:MAG: hypothetical protein KDA22_00955, partial [Phycisphaerales bacterium]|nr:hypothetical protein [Phycisphaerales bacterium]